MHGVGNWQRINDVFPNELRNRTAKQILTHYHTARRDIYYSLTNLLTFAFYQRRTARIAQSVERPAFNRVVVGSSPITSVLFVH